MTLADRPMSQDPLRQPPGTRRPARKSSPPAPRRSSTVGPGTIVADKYRVIRVIASGGQGMVVQAIHLRLNQSVAIKFPHFSSDSLEDRANRLFREARAAFRLRGEHIARVIDADTDGQAPFIVMEYLEGTDLKQLIASRGPLPCDEAIGLVLQACEALAEAHEEGIVHRDLKPSNLFLTQRPDGTPLLKVLDFGLSKTTLLEDGTRDHSELAEPVRMLGSPRYMSPEQVRDARHTDARTDVWALGAILQELLTATPVFRARTRTDVLAMVLTKSPSPLTLLRPEVPAEIEHAVLRCLQKNPEHRFRNVRELAECLAPFAPSWAAISLERLRQRPVTRRSERVTVPPPAVREGTAKTRVETRRRMRGFAAWWTGGAASIPLRMALGTALLAGMTGTVLVSLAARHSPSPMFVRAPKPAPPASQWIIEPTASRPSEARNRKVTTEAPMPIVTASARSNWLALRAAPKLSSRPLRRARSAEKRTVAEHESVAPLGGSRPAPPHRERARPASSSTEGSGTSGIDSPLDGRK